MLGGSIFYLRSEANICLYVNATATVNVKCKVHCCAVCKTCSTWNMICTCLIYHNQHRHSHRHQSSPQMISVELLFILMSSAVSALSALLHSALAYVCSCCRRRRLITISGIDFNFLWPPDCSKSLEGALHFYCGAK